MAKQIENVTNDEFDLMHKQGWIDEEGRLTQTGLQTIFAGIKPPNEIEYRRAGPPSGTDIGVPIQEEGQP